jgi:hypothetical protein
MAVVEVEAEAGCAQCGGLLTKPGQRFCSFVCEATANGHASNLRSRQGANGKLPEPEEEPTPPARAEAAVAPQVCALDGCAAAVTGRLALYCSRAHQRRAARERALAKVVPGLEISSCPVDLGLGPVRPGALEAVGPGVETRGGASHLGLGPFEQLAAVAALLPPGWRLEATSASVTVSVSLA